MKRVCFVHGWEGHPEVHWFPWLKEQVAARGFSVLAPAMPRPDHPQLADWLLTLQEKVTRVDEKTFFVGHSLGCVTILRYLASQKVKTRAGGALLVAPFIASLGIPAVENFLAAPLPDPRQIHTVCPRLVAFVSLNDPYVPALAGTALGDTYGAQLVVVQDAGHFRTSDGYGTFPLLLEKLLALTGE